MRVLLVDGLNLVRRVYAAVPGDEGTDGHFEGALASMGSSLSRALDRYSPSHATVVFDGQGESWRRDEFPDYKKSRKPMPERLQRGLGEVRARFEKFHVTCIEVPAFEADDVIATLAHGIAKRDGAEVMILSTDKHFAQLLRPNVSIHDHFNDRSINAKYIAERYGVTADRLDSLFALAGDTGVDVPGVKGIGIKTAAKLIDEYGDLEAILAAADSVPGKNGERLREHADDARLARRLLALRTDVAVGVNLKDLRFERPGGPQ